MRSTTTPQLHPARTGGDRKQRAPGAGLMDAFIDPELLCDDDERQDKRDRRRMRLHRERSQRHEEYGKLQRTGMARDAQGHHRWRARGLRR